MNQFIINGSTVDEEMGRLILSSALVGPLICRVESPIHSSESVCSKRLPPVKLECLKWLFISCVEFENFILLNQFFLKWFFVSCSSGNFDSFY